MSKICDTPGACRRPCSWVAAEAPIRAAANISPARVGCRQNKWPAKRLPALIVPGPQQAIGRAHEEFLFLGEPLTWIVTESLRISRQRTVTFVWPTRTLPFSMVSKVALLISANRRCPVPEIPLSTKRVRHGSRHGGRRINAIAGAAAAEATEVVPSRSTRMRSRLAKLTAGIVAVLDPFHHRVETILLSASISTLNLPARIVVSFR